ncbi:MAG: glycoside hydrolase family 3 N-terminal domain-containing protein [Ancalomicrobiaceae bacterium]|nr:glycoside hydrolase family 3 N-terminal domain-containing protein [Ancalomicrobiaceae bacterium]
MTRILLMIGLALTLTHAAGAAELPPLDPAIPSYPAEPLRPDPATEKRIDALLAKMTLAEKVGQLRMGGWSQTFDLEEARSGIIGSLTGAPDAAANAAIVKAARQSRLGIPILLTDNVIHGFRTLIPAPIGLAATFDPDLVRIASAWAGYEAAAIGLHWTLSPMIDISRDPRWGRVVEGPGEDPYLASKISAAEVSGLLRGGIIATLKHYVGYGAAEAGRDYNSTWIPPELLHDLYLPPFKAGIDAGAMTVMAAFNALNGLPATANPRMLDGILKHDWGFAGLVTSDWDSVWELQNHGIAADGAEAARKAILAGLDMEMAGDMFKDNLAQEVEAGRVPLARVDDAVRRVLRVKFRLGLFDRPDPDPKLADTRLLTPAAKKTAREIAAASLVLLENHNDTLPFKPGIKKIAVVGSMADTPSDHMGPWGANGREADVVTTLAGLKARAPDGTTVTFAPGCDRECKDTSGFAAAVDAAAAADIVVAVMGETWYHTAEGASRTKLDLPGHYEELLESLVATGKPVVLVVLGGRPMTITWAARNATAILYAWFPGTEAGAAIADVLFGDVDPSGRLPMTFPRAVGQIPIYYAHLPTGRPATGDQYSSKYIDEENDPLYPFGYGLSYGRILYDDLRILTPRIGLDGVITTDVHLTNVGTHQGTETVQLYVHDLVAGRSRPIKELKAFAKVVLAPGESRRVELKVPVADLAYHLDDGTAVVEPGRFQIFIGGSSRATLSGMVVVEGK